MRIAYFGSGEFGCPTLARLASLHEVCVAVTQPAKMAGRGKLMRQTPVAHLAHDLKIPIVELESIVAPDFAESLSALQPDALVVIAYGQKLPESLLAGRFAINLHASLLPKYRGAAPINRAMMAGETETGVSVIELAQRMDAGRILAAESTPIDPEETAGELHDRLSALGPAVVADVLKRFEKGTLAPVEQDESKATRAPKLSRADGWVSLAQPADAVRACIHGLTPWPGCWASMDGAPLRLARVRDHADVAHRAVPGTVLPNHFIACGVGAIELLEVQAPGGRLLTFDAYRHGRPVTPGSIMTSQSPKIAEAQSS